MSWCYGSGSVSWVSVIGRGQCHGSGSVSWDSVIGRGQCHGSVLWVGLMGQCHGSGPVSRVRFHGSEQIKIHGEHTAK